MKARQFLATILTACSGVACVSGESDLPKQRPATTPAAVGSTAALASGYVPACKVASESEGVAAGLVDLLDNADSRTAQFALDSLVLVRHDTMRFLLCQLENDRPTRVRRFYMLNRAPHSAPVPELVAHHDAATVGEAVGLVVGVPAEGGEACPGQGRAGRAACAAAWRAYLERNGRGR